MIKAIIFDVDGTLVDSVDFHAEAWCEAFREFGHEIEFARMRHQIGKGADQLMPVFLSKDELKRYGKKLEKRRKEIFQERYLPRVCGFPGVRELFQAIRAEGKEPVLASSAAGEELEAYKAAAGISDLVRQATSKDDAKKSKPHPDIFAAALDKLDGVGAAEALVIGDTPYDAEAAGKLEIGTIGVLAGGFPEWELRQAGCLAIYRDPEDLLAHYEIWREGKPVIAGPS